MDYSFIDQVSRNPFSAAVRRVWIGGALLVALLLAAAAVLYLYNKELRSAVVKETKTQEMIALQTDQLRQQQAQFELKRGVRQRSSAEDQLLADQLYDLLDLVPDDATLSRFEYDGSSMLYAGVCSDFNALKEGLQRALSGRYRLMDASHAAEGNVVRFTLRFSAKGEVQ
jgi:hypothetical protein